MCMAVVSHKQQCLYTREKELHTVNFRIFFYFIFEAETISRDGGEEGMVLAREAVSELSFCSSI